MSFLNRILHALLISSLFLAAFAYPVAASKGTPNSSTFGYGAIIDPLGIDPQSALNTANQLGLDWIALLLDWEYLQPDASGEMNWSSLDTLIHHAAQQHQSVLIQIEHAPSWAMQADGPNIENVKGLVENLAGRYWPSIQAIELFPFTNTRNAWGAPPNAAHYVTMLQSIKQGLADKDCSIFLISGSLDFTANQNGDIPAEQFLNQLYNAGLSKATDLVGLSLSIAAKQNDSEPDAESPIKAIETIREIMLENNHSRGMLWITHIRIPSGTIMENDTVVWQLCSQIRSHLYIGTLFLGVMNDGTAIQEHGRLGWSGMIASPSFLSTISELIAINNGGSATAGT